MVQNDCSLERGLYIDLTLVCVIEKCTASILRPMEERLHFPQDGTLNILSQLSQ